LKTADNNSVYMYDWWPDEEYYFRLVLQLIMFFLLIQKYNHDQILLFY
jgi:hypothetical protein